VHVRDTIEKRDDEVQPRLECPVEAAEPLDHPRALLRHDAHALDHEGDHQAEQQNPEPVLGQNRDEGRGHGRSDCNRELPEHFFPPSRPADS
jgi:hypothetical protein